MIRIQFALLSKVVAPDSILVHLMSGIVLSLLRVSSKLPLWRRILVPVLLLSRLDLLC